jgi:hypothetical protein
MTHLDDMALKRFKTNRRLWLAVSLALFLPPWFVGYIGKSADEMHAAGLFVVAIHNPEVIFLILGLALMFAIPALAIGWVIHCLIVLVLDFLRGRTRNAAS